VRISTEGALLEGKATRKGLLKGNEPEPFARKRGLIKRSKKA
jgi:hypothetical protein